MLGLAEMAFQCAVCYVYGYIDEKLPWIKKINKWLSISKFGKDSFIQNML